MNDIIEVPKIIPNCGDKIVIKINGVPIKSTVVKKNRFYGNSFSTSDTNGIVTEYQKTRNKDTNKLQWYALKAKNTLAA